MAFRKLAALCLVAMLVGCGGPPSEEVPIMNAADALALPRPGADERISYGDDPLQFGELRLPEGEGPFPTVIVIHGGCWLAQYDVGYMSGLAHALSETGIATWCIEYRRVGNLGGGWPGTFEDVADAADFLTEIGPRHNLDLDRVAALGHSAGGHLALWLAGRRGLDPSDPLRGEEPLELNGVVTLAGIPDLADYASPEGCGAAVAELIGARPAEVPERLRRTSPIAMVPLGISQALVTGSLDTIVPALQADAFADAARRLGDPVRVVEIDGAGHFELVDPAHDAFSVTRDAVLRTLDFGNQP